MANEIESGLLVAALNKIDIDEAFGIVRDTYQGVLGTARMMGAERAIEGHRFAWLEMAVGAGGSAAAAAATDAATTVSVVDGSKFRAGMMVTPEGSDETMLVTAVSGNDLTVVRGVLGAAAAIPQDTVILIDSIGREENSLAENDTTVAPYEVENFFQTMDTGLEFSRRALATLQYGNTNDLTFQLGERVKQLGIQMNRALIRGAKLSTQIGGKTRTYTGGMRYFIDQAGSNVDAGGQALTLEQIDNINADLVARGGTADTIVVGIDKARELNALVSANYASQRLVDYQADKGSVTRLPSDLPLLGNVNQIVVDTHLNANELFIYDSSKLGIKYMAAGNANADGAWRTLDATQIGQDGQAVRILGDFGFEIRNADTHMARLHNLA